MDQSETNVGVRRRQGMMTITSRTKFGKAAVAVVSTGTVENGRLLEESPVAAHLQKESNLSN